MPELSVVVPFYNERDSLPALRKRLVPVLEGISADWEWVLVDDGSGDGSPELVKDWCREEPRVGLISLSRNFGHHTALTAGMDAASGAVVFLMDADLQDRPEEMPRLLSKLNEGYDLVYGIRSTRRDSPFKRLTGFLFWRAIRFLSGLEIPPNQAMLRVMNRKAADGFLSLRERPRFIAGMFAWAGFRQTGIEVEHDPRARGRSKYGLGAMLRLAWNAATGFSVVPLRLALWLGSLVALGSFGLGLYYIAIKLFFAAVVPGFTALAISVLFTGGVQLVVLGVIGEYLGRAYNTSLARPLYLIRETVNLK